MINKILKRLVSLLLGNRSLRNWAKTIDSGKQGRRRIVADYKKLFKSKGLTTDEYFDFEFEKRDEGFRQSFLGLNEQRFYLDYLNPVKYYSLARNKYLAHKTLENTGVRKSELYCYYQPEARYIASDECAGDLSGVLHILESKGIESCVIKTTESSHGDNVWVIKDIQFEERDAMLTRFDGSVIRLSEILGKEPLIFESVVHQTKQFADFNETSVNTVRFMTTLYPDGTAKIIATFVKIGSPGRCVDNAGEGGNVDACIDVETGEIKDAVLFNGWRKTIEIDKHPDSGVQLNGVFVENWQLIKEEVKRFQQAFPYCKAAGWDIAITEDGPVVIEVNDFWDRTGQYFIRRGWRNEIRDCYLAWKQYWGGNVNRYATGNWRLPLKDRRMIAKFS
ncbi:MAG: hypothetical protein IJK96_03640 [Bacteroidales bacterium]|nr:hypothetical protein [Bacteroidales bacterium]